MQIELSAVEEINRTGPPADGSGRISFVHRLRKPKASGISSGVWRQTSPAQLAMQQNRWTDFNSRLDDLESALSR